MNFRRFGAVLQQLRQKFFPAGQVGEFSVKLGFEAGVEDFLEARAGGEAGGDDVAAQDNRRGDIARDCEFRRAFEQPLAAAGFVGRERAGGPSGRPRPPARGGRCGRLFWRGGARRCRRPCSASARAGACGRAPAGRTLSMSSLCCVSRASKRQRRRFARGLVAERADVPVGLVRCRRGFAEVVAQHREADDQILPGVAGAARGKGVEAVQGVNPHVAFGMPLRVLRAADERGEFREKFDPAAGAQKFQPERGFSSLSPKVSAIPRTRARWKCRPWSASRTARRSPARRRVRSARRVASRAARAAGPRQSARWCGAKFSRADRPTPLKGSISSRVSGSHEMALRVKSRRAAASRNDMAGSASTAKSVCSGPVRRSRRGSEISSSSPRIFSTPKLLPTVMTGIGRRDEFFEVRRFEAENLQVRIFGGLPEQGVAHASADQQCPPARRVDALRQVGDNRRPIQPARGQWTDYQA